MDIKEELVKALVKLDSIQESLQALKELNQRVDSLENFRAYTLGALGVVCTVVPLLIEWFK